MDSISLCFYGDSTGIRMWNNPNDPMPIKIANGKTLEQCVYYRGGGITVYTDNSVTVKSYPGFYDYYLANERKMSEVMMLPVEGEEIVKDEEYYEKLINGLAIDYNKQVENAPNIYRSTMVLQDVNTPAPIDFACTVFADGQIWIGEGYSVGAVDRPPCPVNVPSGKLAFVTPATSDTHSFVIKGVTNNNSPGLISKHHSDSSYWKIEIKKIHKKDILVSSSYINENVIRLAGSTNSNTLFITFGNRQFLIDSFSQHLIYKANLTETELKAELAKDIKLR
ncbi:MAG: hypothetical protein ACRDDY_10805 [Clostridium sp.]|uniref:hypothetical protein n=1 Tax=Clostridium sp. TaxID=1506 RepID=UPI003EE52A3F